MLEHACFIEYPGEFHPEFRKEEPAPMFRRHFTVAPGLKKGTLAVCGLGYGDYWLDGSKATEDLFIAPFGEYNKTLWYTTYDITERLTAGEHLLAVMLGNGYYNESLLTAWDFDQASWRALPKLLLELRLEYENRTEFVYSDESWVCAQDCSPVRFNQLRSGETYDARMPLDWNQPYFDDSTWVKARKSEKIPAGVLRACTCQPIREWRTYEPKEIFQNKDGHWVIDFGQNMSGYIRMTVRQPAGDVITVRYSEELNPDGTRRLNGMGDEYFFKVSEFQTDRFICGSEAVTWSPRFTYHGFRYAVLEGLREKPRAADFRAVFVCQAVEPLSEFECSEMLINQLYEIGKMATRSNLFYMITDCPTREKLGWANDAQASLKQMFQNFDMTPLAEKWLQDFYDSMREDGMLPGIAPTAGWGYEWGSGPVSNGILFELPYQIYRNTDNKEPLCSSIPYFARYLTYADSKVDPEDGLVLFGLLPDWAGPFEPLGTAPTPMKMSDTLLIIKFSRIAVLAAKLSGDTDSEKKFKAREERLVQAVRRAYLDPATGRCAVEEQTAVSMMIMLGLYDELEPLKQQLHELIVARDYHHHCGMLGLQYIYPALDFCGLQEDAYRIVTAKTRPCYKEWLDHGATTMWEMWNTGSSKNHHMNSSVLGWFAGTLVGLQLDTEVNAYKRFRVVPYFAPELTYCKGSYRTASGLISIDWRRETDITVRLNVDVPDGTEAVVQLADFVLDDGLTLRRLPAGHHSLICTACTAAGERA